jgi:hypothetical protein
MRSAPRILLAAGALALAAAAAFALTRRGEPSAVPSNTSASSASPASPDRSADAAAYEWKTVADSAAPDTGDACVLVAEKALPPPPATDTFPYRVDDHHRDVRGERRFACPFGGGQTLTVETRASHFNVVDSVRILLPGKAPQMLAAMDEASPTPLGPPLLRAPDIDGDGHRDLMLLGWVSAHANTGHDVWLYRPREAAFAYDSALSRQWRLNPIGNGCWESSAKEGGMRSWHGRFCRVGGRDVEMESSYSEPDSASGAQIHTFKERRGGRMVVVRVDTIP